MTTIRLNDVDPGGKVFPLISQPQVWTAPIIAELTAMSEKSEEALSGTIAENALDEWAVGSACYMCHTCTNFGVQGAEGRPCAKGLSDLIKRRSKARMKVQAARRDEM